MKAFPNSLFLKEVIIPIWALKKHDLLFYGQEMSKIVSEAKEPWKTYH